MKTKTIQLTLSLLLAITFGVYKESSSTFASESLTPAIGETTDSQVSQSFTLNARVVRLRVGETFQLKVIWKNPEWATANNNSIYFYSHTRSISVNNDGLIKAHRPDVALVHVDVNGTSSYCKVIISGNDDTDKTAYQKGRMTLPIGRTLHKRDTPIKATHKNDVIRLRGIFRGQTSIPSELEYEILDGIAYFDIYPYGSDSISTDGWEESSMTSQYIDVSFNNCTSDTYEIHINNVYHTVTDISPDSTSDTQGLTAEIGETSIHITGYYYCNCAAERCSITAKEKNGVITLMLKDLIVGDIVAACGDYYHVDFTIPRMSGSKKPTKITAYDKHGWPITIISKEFVNPHTNKTNHIQQ